MIPRGVLPGRGHGYGQSAQLERVAYVEINHGDPGDGVPAVRTRPIVINGTLGGKIEYMCGIQLMAMLGTIHIV